MISKKFFITTSLIFLLGSMAFLFLISPAVADKKELAVGVIDIEKVMNDWPKFKGYSQQLKEEELAYSVLLEKATPNLTDAEKGEMQYQITRILDHSNVILMEVLTNEIGKASEKVAIEKGMDMVVIKQRVNFGGTDITDDVIKLLK